MSTESFRKLGDRYIKQSLHGRSDKIRLRRFKSFFGTTPRICAIIWAMLEHKRPSKSAPKHLLWCLLFLKQYNVEHTRRAILKTNEKTLRHWTWIYINLLADLDVVI